MGLRLKYADETFWCGKWLGGCGRQITTRIGRVNVPHFAHFPDALATCGRTRTDAASADHLFISRDLRQWLGRQGVTTETPEFFGNLGEGGSCTGLVMRQKGGRRSFVVVLDDQDVAEWKRLYEQFEQASHVVHWLYAPSTSIGRKMVLRGDSGALFISCHYLSGDRRLQIGSSTSWRGDFEWNDVGECLLTADQLLTPRLAHSQSTAESRQVSKRGRSGSNEIEQRQQRALALFGEASHMLSLGNVKKAKLLHGEMMTVLDELGNGYLSGKARKLARKLSIPGSPAPASAPAKPKPQSSDIESAHRIGTLLDLAFESVRQGRLEDAVAEHADASRLLQRMHVADPDLMRRARTCAAQITQKKSSSPSPAAPIVPFEQLRERLLNQAVRKRQREQSEQQAAARKAPIRREGLPASQRARTREERAAVRVAPILHRVRSERPTAKLLGEVRGLLEDLPRYRFTVERREFQKFLRRYEDFSGAELAQIPRPTPKKMAAQSKNGRPRARCSCGWEGKSARFERHKALPGYKGKRHFRMR